MSIPVSVKIRSGPDGEHETAADVARRAEAAGAAAVSVHARSVAQGYVGGADWGVVARVKQAVAIPVIGSGGIRTPSDAVRLLRESGADAVAIGRGCLGNPWIFQQARALWSGGRETPRPQRRRGCGSCWNSSRTSSGSTAQQWRCDAFRARVVTLPSFCRTTRASEQPSETREISPNSAGWCADSWGK